MRAEKVVKALLEASAGVTALVGSKIFLCTADEQTAAPLIIFRKQTATRSKPTLPQGAMLVDALIEVLCIGATAEQMLNLGEAVRVALVNQVGENVSGTGVKIFRLMVADETEQLYSPDLREYAQGWVFLVQHLEP